MHNSRIFSVIWLVLGILQIAIILVSWIITAAMPEMAMRSLLSSEGIRWFFGHFTENLSTPVLVWLLLISISYGSLRQSGLYDAIASIKSLDYAKRFALHLVLFELVIVILIILLLTAVPHAVLLSVTGHLFPSSFSNSIIPIVCFAVCMFSVSYGLMSGTLRSLKSVFHNLSIGMNYSMPLWILYVLGAELYASVRFVFEL